MTVPAVQARLRRESSARDARALQWFFKTGPGEYGEGDVFLGVKVPKIRAVAREFRAAPERVVKALLASRIHEERLLALLILVDQFERGSDADRARIVRLYLASTARINNWDLVDLSAPNIVGAWLLERDRSRLDRLARSRSLWERRIAIVATHAFIRRGQFADTLRVADRLLADGHDLIHKAVGWMLREVGKRDRAALEAFLQPRCRRMPRTMLRYAIERFPEPRRQAYLRGEV
jgi:3-methyladenine DNA glycosylase AlkD